MHMRGTPKTMQTGDLSSPAIAEEVAGFLASRCQHLERLGVSPDRLCVDPGIGFGKTLEQNLHLQTNLKPLRALNRPILMGASRKSFIGSLTGRPSSERVWGTAASVAVSVWLGVHIVRVHDVKAMNDVVRVANALARSAGGHGFE